VFWHCFYVHNDTPFFGVIFRNFIFIFIFIFIFRCSKITHRLFKWKKNNSLLFFNLLQIFLRDTYSCEPDSISSLVTIFFSRVLWLTMIHVRPRKLTCPVRRKILFFLCREACFGPAMGNFVWGFMCEDREGRQPWKGNSSCNGKPEIQFRKDTLTVQFPSKEYTSTQNRWITKALLYIQSNLHEWWRLPDWGKKLALIVTTCHKFRRLVQEPRFYTFWSADIMVQNIF